MAAIPWAALIIAAGLRRAPPECEEAALLETTPAAVFGRITLPCSIDSLGLAALWIFIATIGEITAADMYQVNNYARELYIGFALGEFLIGPGESEAAASATFGVWPGVVVTGWLGLAAAAFLTRLAHWETARVAAPAADVCSGASSAGGGVAGAGGDRPHRGGAAGELFLSGGDSRRADRRRTDPLVEHV
jgi:ABC-type Fe3+ transport system permease subunit